MTRRRAAFPDRPGPDRLRRRDAPPQRHRGLHADIRHRHRARRHPRRRLRHLLGQPFPAVARQDRRRPGRHDRSRPGCPGDQRARGRRRGGPDHADRTALEGYVVGKTRGAIAALLKLAPREATVVRDGREITLPVEQPGTGRPRRHPSGRAHPRRRTVRRGSPPTQAALTGESLPATKTAGDTVYTGTINTPRSPRSGGRGGRRGHDAGADRPAAEDAPRPAAPVQRPADRWAVYFVPTVLALGALDVRLQVHSLRSPLEVALTRMAAALIIACPCALILATPTGIARHRRCVARRGILTRGGVHLETPGTSIAWSSTRPARRRWPSRSGRGDRFWMGTRARTSCAPPRRSEQGFRPPHRHGRPGGASRGGAPPGTARRAGERRGRDVHGAPPVLERASSARPGDGGVAPCGKRVWPGRAPLATWWATGTNWPRAA